MPVIFSHINSREFLDARICFSSLATRAAIVSLSARAPVAVG